MAYVDPVTGQRIGGAKFVSGVPWPDTRDARHAMIRDRWRAYRKESFADDDIARWALFVAKDSSDRITAVTQRIVRDYQFVCDTDARAISTDGVALTAAPSAPAGALEAGQLEWTASQIAGKLPEWALSLCVEGRGYLDVIQRADDKGPAIVWHSDTEVDIETDAAGLEVTRAIITIMEPPPVTLDAEGRAEPQGPAVRYVREITPTGVRAWRDGVLVPAESGSNPLGVVPVVPVTFGYGGPGGMPMSAAQGLDDVLALINSTITQIATIGSRNGNPMLLAIGARLADGADLQAQGRILSTPKESDIRWLELSMQGLGALVTQITSIVEMTRQTMPEFLFMDSGANASGTALGYRAGAFVAKMQPVRAAMYGGLARAVSMAVAMREGRAWDEADAETYAVEGGSALPMDLQAQIAIRTDLVERGLMRRGDAVAWLQGARVLPQGVDPEAYAAQALAELDATTRALSDALEMLQRLQGSQTLADVVAATEDDEAEQPEPPDMPQRPEMAPEDMPDDMPDDEDAPDDMAEQ